MKLSVATIPGLPRLIPVLVVAIAFSACASSASETSDTDARSEVEADAVSESEPAESAAAHGSPTELGIGPVSVIGVLHGLLPSAEDLGEDWQGWPHPVIHIPEACGMQTPEARTGVLYLRFSEDSLIGSELRFGISQFSSESEAEADLAWLNSDASDQCDILMRPQQEQRLKESTAGAFSVGEASRGRAVRSPLADAQFDSHPDVETSSAGRVYDVQYVGQNETLDLFVDVTYLQFEDNVVWLERVARSEDELPQEALDLLLTVGQRVLDVGDISQNSATDALGERARDSVVSDLVPDRFGLFGGMVFGSAEPLGDCISPDPTSALFELDGPVWSSLQGRAGERLSSEVLAFSSEVEAEAYWDSLVADGEACLATAPIWEEPFFVDQQVDQRLESRSWIGSAGEEDEELAEVLVLTSSAQQKLADLTVEVEFSVSHVRRGQMIFIIEFAGLAGDGDFAHDLAVEASRRAYP